MHLTMRCFRLCCAIVGIGGCADEGVEHGWNCENRENEKETARKASVLSHIAPHIGWHDDPIRLGCRHHGNAAVLGYLDVGMDTRNHYFVWLWSTAEYNCPMIPLRIYRTLIVLFLVSGFLALVEMLGVRIGLPANLNSILSGVVAGGIVFGLVFQGGPALVFCGKGWWMIQSEDPRFAMRWWPSALLEERRKNRRRKRQKEAFTGQEQRRDTNATTPRMLMYVSVVQSDRFIAITVRAGRSHRAFVSTRMVDSLSPAALRGVLAHELGHALSAHPLKQAVLLGIVASVKLSIGVPVGAVVVILMAYLFMLTRVGVHCRRGCRDKNQA
jgi:hypothetical protein